MIFNAIIFPMLILIKKYLIVFLHIISQKINRKKLYVNNVSKIIIYKIINVYQQIKFKNVFNIIIKTNVTDVTKIITYYKKLMVLIHVVIKINLILINNVKVIEILQYKIVIFIKVPLLKIFYKYNVKNVKNNFIFLNKHVVQLEHI